MHPMRFLLAAVVATFGLGLVSAPVAMAADGKLDGLVTMRGKPMTGKITFHSGDQFFGSKVNAEGKFKVDRAMVGTYKVTIEGKGVPAKYSSEDFSPLTVEVKEGDNTFDFEIQ